jgi:hypothetical protein
MKTIIEQAKEIRRQTIDAAHGLSDANALKALILFDEWKTSTGTPVSPGLRVTHDGRLYECVQAHTPQTGWEPTATPALWKQVSVEEFPQWKQPAGGHDAYKKGDKVIYNNAKWVSTADANVWQPGVYGWSKI